MSDYDRYSVYIDSHVKNGVINIDPLEYKKFRKGLGKNYENRMIDEINMWIQKNYISYPSLKNIINFNVVNGSFSMFKVHKKKLISPIFNVKGVHPKRLTLKGKHYVILIDPDYYIAYGYMIDFFQDDISNKEIWKANSKKIVSHSIKKYKAATSETLRISMRELYKDKINQLNILVAQTVLKIFKCTRILDPFMGKGEKLLAALSVDNVISYQGINSDYEPFEGYSAMLEFNRSRCRTPIAIDLICSDFMDVDVLNTCDLIFANPSSDIIPSTLLECLQKAWLVLELKGHLLLAFETDMIMSFLSLVDKTLIGSKYRGCIGYAEDLSTDGVKKFSDPKPIYIWRKTI